MISIKLLYTFIEIALRHGSSPVNLLHIFRTPFPKNTSYGLLLKIEREILIALNDEINGKTHFCLSLTDKLKKHSPRKNVLAKSKLISFLVELMDD